MLGSDRDSLADRPRAAARGGHAQPRPGEAGGAPFPWRERERLLAEISAGRERLRSLILEMPAPAALFAGPDHRCEVANEAYRSVCGGGREVEGLTAREAFPQLEQQWILESFDAVYRTGQEWCGFETLVRHEPDGSGGGGSWLNVHITPVHDANGMVTGILNLGIDVTLQVLARREAERVLSESETARRLAEEANRAKADFLAVMSHELRTPLNAISGYADLLDMEVHGPLSQAQRRAVNRIQLSQKHLLGLINQVLTYAKLESGSVRYDVTEIFVHDALFVIEAMIEPQARARDVQVEIAECAREVQVLADPDKLHQILVNLLANAIKFTEPGGRVVLSCEMEAPHARLVVSDTGIGIPRDKLETIFEPFVQVRADLERTAAGTGLGLAISRTLARGMGGDLVAESTPGNGSTFTLLLPARGD